MDLSNVEAVPAFHDRALPDEAGLAHAPDAVDPAVAAMADNHRCNIRLWAAEDQARRRDMPDAYIVQCKREIDRHNQQRNDAVERLDEALLQSLAGVTVARTARLHSETPGAIIDRLSILSLKIFHMGRQARRTDAGTEHLAACTTKLQRLIAQRVDLAACLAQLWNECQCGDAYFKLYRQFKMYNDPALNPWLQAGAGAVHGRDGEAATDNAPHPAR